MKDSNLKEYYDLGKVDGVFVLKMKAAIAAIKYEKRKQRPNKPPSSKLEEAVQKLVEMVQRRDELRVPVPTDVPKFDLSEDDIKVLRKLHTAVRKKDVEKMEETINELEALWIGTDGVDGEVIFQPEQGVNQVPEVDLKAMFLTKTKVPKRDLDDQSLQEYVIEKVPRFPTKAELKKIKAERAAAQGEAEAAEAGEEGSD